MYNHQFMSTSKQLPVVVQSEGIVLTEITILVAFQMAMELLALSYSIFHFSLYIYIYAFSLYLIFSIHSIILKRSNILLYNMEASNNQQEQNQSHTFQLVSQVPSSRLPSIMTTLAASVAQKHLKVIRNEQDIDGHHLDQQISSQVSELQKQMKNSFLGLVKKVSQGAAQVQEQIECLQNVCKLLQLTSGKSQQNSIYAQVYIQTEAYKCKLKQLLAWIEGYIKIVNNPSESNENLPKIIQIFVEALHEDKFNLSNQSNYYLTRLLINKIVKFNGSFIRSWSIQKASFQQNNKFQVLFLIRQRISFLKSKIRNQRQLDDDSGQAEQRNKIQLQQQQQKLPYNSNNAEQVQDLPEIIQDPMEQLKQRNMKPEQGFQPNNEILDQHSHKNDSLDLSISRNDGDKKEYQEQAKEMDSFEYQISQSLANRLSSKQDNWNSIHDFLDKPNNESPLPPLADPSSSVHQLESILDKNNRIQYRNIKLIEQAPEIELKKQNKISEKHEWHGPQIADSSPSPFQLQNQMYMSENKREMQNDDNFLKDSVENEHAIEQDQQEVNRNKQKSVKQVRLISRRKQEKKREKEQQIKQIGRKITRSSNQNVIRKDMKQSPAIGKDGRKQMTDINTPSKTTKTKKSLIQTLIDKSQQVQRMKKQKYLQKIRKLFYLLKSKYQITLHQYVDVCEEIHKMLVWFMKGFIRKLLMVAKMRNRRYTGQHYGDQFRYFSESNNNLFRDLIKNSNIFSQLNTNGQPLDEEYGHDIRQSAQNFEPQANLYKVCYPSKLESYQRIKIGEISDQDKLYKRIHAFDLQDNQGMNKKVQIQKLKKNELVMAKHLVDGYHKEKIEFQKEENGLPTGRLIVTTNMIVDVALADWDWIAMADIGFYRGF